MGNLYIVATPIGNLKDISLRALEILKSVDLILAEDTRVVNKLLAHYEIRKPVWRYDEYAKDASYAKIKNLLLRSSNIALVTDAGTPAIADPGSKLITFIQKELPEAKIIPIPGASALTTALSAAGVNADQFTFLGYPPHKKGRQTFFRELKEINIRPIVFYESPHRVEKTFRSLEENFGDAEIIVARELTKIHEEIWHGTAKAASAHFQGEKKKGEFVIIIP
ncbi:MAG: 16S rRNA (cytidine(1402)-2'-O)-methyltransferase [Minisyncoccia bacterium]|jgi:16S rRNA (cytidine1402-2'-O)-methyltransferase